MTTKQKKMRQNADALRASPAAKAGSGMSARELTIFGVVFLILALLTQEFFGKVSEPILELTGCSSLAANQAGDDAMQVIIRGTTIPYAISIVFLLFPRLLRAFDKWREWRSHRRDCK